MNTQEMLDTMEKKNCLQNIVIHEEKESQINDIETKVTENSPQQNASPIQM